MVVANRKAVRALTMRGRKIGGVRPRGKIAMWPLMTGKRVQMTEVILKKGFFHPLHSHPRNESIGYVLSGRLRMRIGDEEFLLGPGDAWHHGLGAYHSSEALEDTHLVEAHTPPRRDYVVTRAKRPEGIRKAKRGRLRP